MRQRNRIPFSAFTAALLCTVAVGTLFAGSAPASAQVERRAMDANIFRPAMDSQGIFVVDRADLGKPWHWGFRFAMNGAVGPMNLAMSGIEDGASTTPVDYAINFHVGFHVTFTKWLGLAIDVPFARQGLGLAYDGDETGGFVFNDPLSNTGKEPQSVTAGDPRVSLKFRLFGIQGFSMALAAMVTLPFGDEATFNGAGGVTAEPRLIATYTRGRISLGLNVGYLFRPIERVFDPALAGDPLLVEIDDELTWGVGASIRLTKFMGLGVEMYGRAPLIAHKDYRDLPLEGLAGLIFKLGHITWAIGGGVGVGSFLTHHDIKPFGRAPAWRMFTTLAFVPALTKTTHATKDTDGDGIDDAKDQCPTSKEDADGFEDDDGCPDPDNDQDGISDAKDKCPNKAEDRDGFKDTDGCPETDNDGDGIPDGQDKCPDEAEDKDGFKDDDGCPDGDNDGDGIPDSQDKCPNEAEDRNGVDDGDGCPEGSAGSSIRGGKIDLRGKRIQFKSGAAVLIKKSYKILDRIANMLRNNPRVKLVRIEGHTDDRGRARTNQRLSQSRAATVRDYLVKRGVARNRLTAVGYGETRPKVPNTSRKNRGFNRRVEFIIVHQTR
jgi:large repetitive protein